MSADATSPDWDMTPYFDEFDGIAYRAFREALAADAARLQQEAQELGAITKESIADWTALLVQLEERFGISIDAASLEIDDLRGIGKIASLVARMVQ